MRRSFARYTTKIKAVAVHYIHQHHHLCRCLESFLRVGDEDEEEEGAKIEWEKNWIKKNVPTKNRVHVLALVSILGTTNILLLTPSHFPLAKTMVCLTLCTNVRSNAKLYTHFNIYNTPCTKHHHHRHREHSTSSIFMRNQEILDFLFLIRVVLCVCLIFSPFSHSFSRFLSHSLVVWYNVRFSVDCAYKSLE